MVSPPQVKESPPTEFDLQTDAEAAPSVELDRTPAERLSVVLPEDIPTEPIYRLSVAQYHAMLDAGILLSGDPIELLEGWLVLKMTKNPPHTATNRRTKRVLESILPNGWFISTQDPITIAPRNEPEPDVMIVRGDLEAYTTRHPIPAEVAAVIEISDTTLKNDRGVKQRIFARAGIPFYWIINVLDLQIEAHSEPKGGTYQQRTIYGINEAVPLIIEGEEIARINVSDLLPTD